MTLEKRISEEDATTIMHYESTYQNLSKSILHASPKEEFQDLAKKCDETINKLRIILSTNSHEVVTEHTLRFLLARLFLINGIIYEHLQAPARAIPRLLYGLQILLNTSPKFLINHDVINYCEIGYLFYDKLPDRTEFEISENVTIIVKNGKLEMAVTTDANIDSIETEDDLFDNLPDLLTPNDIAWKLLEPDSQIIEINKVLALFETDNIACNFMLIGQLNFLLFRKSINIEQQILYLKYATTAFACIINPTDEVLRKLQLANLCLGHLYCNNQALSIEAQKIFTHSLKILYSLKKINHLDFHSMANYSQRLATKYKPSSVYYRFYNLTAEIFDLSRDAPQIDNLLQTAHQLYQEITSKKLAYLELNQQLQLLINLFHRINKKGTANFPSSGLITKLLSHMPSIPMFSNENIQILLKNIDDMFSKIELPLNNSDLKLTADNTLIGEADDLKNEEDIPSRPCKVRRKY